MIGLIVYIQNLKNFISKTSINIGGKPRYEINNNNRITREDILKIDILCDNLVNRDLNKVRYLL